MNEIRFVLIEFSNFVEVWQRDSNFWLSYCEITGLLNVNLPNYVFSYIDQGRNPQLYTKDCIEKALAKNEQVKGKIDAYRKFKANMLLELGKTFPTELSKYRALRGDEGRRGD